MSGSNSDIPHAAYNEEEDSDHLVADQLLMMGKRRFTGNPEGNDRSAVDVKDNDEPSQDEQEEEDTRSVTSEQHTLHFFEPRLLTVFKAYNRATSPDNEHDCSGHIMATCLVHFVDFCCWARSSEDVVSWITKITNDNIDLRPRVRNGLVLLFVYAVSAAKASKIPGSDMFSVLQDPDNGLGIINRTSLRVYNDNLFYFSFLKLCLSGLIVAGLVPENERVNQPKRFRKSSDNTDEISAYHCMRAAIFQLIRDNMLQKLKQKMKEILSVWQSANKSMRVLKFSMALNVLNAPIMTPNSQMSYLSTVPADHLIRDYNALFPAQTMHATPGAMMASSGSTAGPLDSFVASRFGGSTSQPLSLLPTTVGVLPMQSSISSTRMFPEEMTARAKLARLSEMVPEESNNGTISAISSSNASAGLAIGSTLCGSVSSPSPHQQYPVPSALSALMQIGPTGDIISAPLVVTLLCFRRTTQRTWSVKTAKIYDILSFLESSKPTIFLLDIYPLGSVATDGGTRTLESKSTRPSGTLELELNARNALVASWRKDQYSQLQEFLRCAARCGSLHDAWNSGQLGNTGSNSYYSQTNVEAGHKCKPSSEFETSVYYLAVDESIPEMLLIRNCPSIGLNGCCWRYFYFNEFADDSKQPFDSYLSSIFPQFRIALERSGSIDRSSIIVQYYPQQLESTVESFLGSLSTSTANPAVTQSCGTNATVADSSLLYQTIGQLSDPTSSIICSFLDNTSLPSSCRLLCHELVLTLL